MSVHMFVFMLRFDKRRFQLSSYTESEQDLKMLRYLKPAYMRWLKNQFPKVESEWKTRT